MKKEIFLPLITRLLNSLNTGELVIVDPTEELLLKEITEQLTEQGYLLIIGNNDYNDSHVAIFNNQKQLVNSLYNYIINGETGHPFPIVITSVALDEHKHYCFESNDWIDDKLFWK